MSKLLIVVRWMAVLPAWLLAYLAAGVAFMVVQWIGGVALDETRDSIYFTGWLVAVRAAFSGAAGMVAVAWIAPVAKREASLVVASIVGTLSIIMFGIVCLQWRAGLIPGIEVIWMLLDGAPATIAGFVVASRVPHGSDDAKIIAGGWLSGSRVRAQLPHAD